MQYLFGSEIPIFCVYFRDYVRAKYQVELELRPIEKNGLPMTGVYLEENCQYFAEIVQEKDEFLKKPFDPQYQQASWQTGDIQTHSPKLMPSWQFHRLALLKQQKFTLFLTALCCLIYFCQLIGFEDVIFSIAHYPEDAQQQGELWRYFSHSLVHLSLWHIFFNLAWWWLFGGAIEKAFGSITLILLYFCTALLTGFAQNLASGPAFFGLSGVVYVVLGFVFVVDKWSNISFDLPPGFFTMLLVGIALGFIAPLIGIEMGNTAHISGLILGSLFGIFATKLARKG
ncbi:rhomboid family intramembrane serine protease [[Pasteurella] aerogenes]